MSKKQEKQYSRMLLPLWMNQHGKCHYCGRFTIPVRLIPELPGSALSKNQRVVIWWGFAYSAASVEHLTPQHAGGSNKLSNLRMACVPCNNNKNDREQKAKAGGGC